MNNDMTKTETARERETAREKERGTQRDLLAKKEELRGKWLDWTFAAPSVVGY